MSNNPEDIKRDIETTRRELSQDVDALTDKVSPARVVERRVDRAKGAATGLKERVLGVTATGTDGAANGLSSTSDRISSAPTVARQRTQGNPLAAGAVAFGVGYLVSSLVPASEKEQYAAMALKKQASEHAEAIKEPLSEAASQMKDNLAAPAQEAVESLRSSATEAASTVQSQAKSAAVDVREQAR